MPWFALGRIYRTPAEWRQVIERAVSALGAFQSGVGEISEWSGPLSIGDELRRQADLADSTIGLRDATRALVASRGRALDGLSASRWPWQHGDFSLNNLLIARDEISIIDLEDLGATSVPLHDEIGLALSIRLAAPQASLPTAECLALCTSASAARHGFSRAQVDGLLLHHLLWRINACGEWSRRRALLDILVDLLNRFTDSPREFLAPEADGSDIWLHRRVHA
jgi:hypothetical protein